MCGRTERILMYKAPVEGAVKTRLAESIGDERALALYRWLGRRQWIAAGEGAALVYFTPDTERDAMEAWLATSARLAPQGKGDLGERMGRAVEEALGRPGVSRAILVGADCPSLGDRDLIEAEARLDDADVVIGPSVDGGYYLLGLKRFEIELFREIPWGTEKVLPLTLERCAAAGASVALLESREDVDDLQSLQSLRAFIDPGVWSRLFD